MKISEKKLCFEDIVASFSSQERKGQCSSGVNLYNWKCQSLLRHIQSLTPVKVPILEIL